MSVSPGSLSADEPKAERHEAELSHEAPEWSYDTQVPVKTFRAHTDSVTAARFCLSDTHFVSCSSDCTTRLWEVETCRPVRDFTGGHERTITECAMIPDTNRMVTVSWDKKMVSWDMETGQMLWKCRQPGLLTSCSSSADGRLLVCASVPQNGVYISDAASGQTVHHINGYHKTTISRCRFDPESKRIVSVSADRCIKLWDLHSHKTTVSIDSNHSNAISDCCFTSNGHFLCTASWDKTLKLWDLQSGGFRSHGGTSLQRGHEGSVSSCRFSNDGALLVSGSFDKTVSLWDMTSLSQTLSLKGHSDWVTDVCISVDRKLVISASKDHTIRMWDIENIDEIPAVMEQKKTQGIGVHILKCEECGKPFPVSRLQTSELLTKCVFCRLKSPPRYRPQPPPLMPL
ncbi:WD repeat-containing protein 88-like [Boleophthalmus pectinirostris]|uniref:WD repeat-containing protein 88-like n=1 Tax=Boleophthalmus pectinirostris TaxID=150288 RepID=UPI00242F93C8|nr:WD repeat-containing protein 88-like [Boleophthalmus pectinirostris]